MSIPNTNLAISFVCLAWVLVHPLFPLPVQLSSVTQSCTTLCNPMDCSMPGFPIHHQLPKLAQTHVHRVGDAIQPSHPLLAPSPPALNLSQHQVFSNESALLIRWPKYWNFPFSISPSNEYSKLISFRIDWFWSPCSPRNSQESSPTPQFKSINSTSIHDHRKNHSLD